jgi:hypothetical protein
MLLSVSVSFEISNTHSIKLIQVLNKSKKYLPHFIGRILSKSEKAQEKLAALSILTFLTFLMHFR